MPTHIGDDQIKQITQEAIIHFGELDFPQLCDSMTGAGEYTYYQDILSKYPVSVAALEHAGFLDDVGSTYPKIESAPLAIPGVSAAAANRFGAFKKVVQNGISEKIDPELLAFLWRIETNQMPFFFTHCFKTLTRNFGKLTRIMEYVLTHNTPFVTNNFYIENGYVERRSDLVRAPYSASLDEASRIRYPGAGKRHNWALNIMRENLGQTAAQPAKNLSNKIGRNDPCPCGSGKKYKQCCGKLY